MFYPISHTAYNQSLFHPATGHKTDTKLITQPPVDHVYNLIIILKHTPVITIICLIDSSDV